MSTFNVLDGNGAVFFSHTCVLEALDVMRTDKRAKCCKRDDGALIATPDPFNWRAMFRTNRGIATGSPDQGIFIATHFTSKPR